jgi:threonylcarbamoyladenosine tRNA methylthiotransferase MtaB
VISLNVSFFTLGCKVNQFETDAMKEIFKKEGFKITEPSPNSDIFVVNSCTVTSASDKKTRSIVNRFKRMNTKSIIVLAGCYAQANQGNQKKLENIDIVIGTKHKDKVVEYVKDYLIDYNILHVVDGFKPEEKYEEMSISHTSERTRANIKIQDGCRQFCTYCIIPFVRGPLRSREISVVLKEIKRLHKNGYKEIVLNGIHMTSYGVDRNDGSTLVKLVEEINNLGLKNIRYRFGSLEPSIIEEKLLTEMIKGNFCDHFHLSLQSGSDSVLKRMNRNYTVKEYEEKVRLIREYMPNAELTTDIIVGFPGETEEEFVETCEYVEKIKFSKVHVFGYSPREGTKAFDMKNQVDNFIKKERTGRLINISELVSADICKKYVGESLDVLYENLNSEGYYVGHSSNYLMIHTKSNNNLHNLRKTVKITFTEGSILHTEEVKI